MNIKKLFILNLTHKVELGLENKKERLKRSFMGFSLTKLILALSIIVVSSLTTQCSCSKTEAASNPEAPAACVDGIGAIGACTGCNAGFYLTTANTCLSLPTSCREADGSGVCTTCVDGFDLSGGACFVRVTINYNLNGGTKTDPQLLSQTARAGGSVTLHPSTGLSRTTGGTADVFLGWSTAQTPVQGDWVAAGSTFNIPAGIAIAVPTITLYAIWGVAYTVTYDANGGTGGTNLTQSTVAGAAIRLRTLAETGITAPASGTADSNLAAWGIAANGVGTTYAAGAEVTFIRDTRLYALWNHTVTFNCGTAAGITGTAPAAVIRRIGADLSDLPRTGCVNSGYTVTGWTSQVGTGDARPLVTFMPAGNITVYAIYRVDIDGDGLIEIYNADHLNAIRYNLSGTSWKSSAISTGLTGGCPAGVCRGYELVGNIDLGTTRWGTTSGYTGTDRLSSGWDPIGQCQGSTSSCSTTNSFNAIFEGNGFEISNLFIYQSAMNKSSGLFSGVGLNGSINGLGLNIVWISSASSKVGGLVGDLANLTAAANSTTPIVRITNTYVINAQITGRGNIGGILGGGRGHLELRNVYTSGNISVDFKASSVDINEYEIGSLIGRMLGGSSARFSVHNAYSVANLYFSGTSAGATGGLIGVTSDGRTIISNAFYSGTFFPLRPNDGVTPITITTNQIAGGILGEISLATQSIDLSNIYWNRQTTGGAPISAISVFDSARYSFSLDRFTGIGTTVDMRNIDLGTCFNRRVAESKLPQVYKWSGTACLVGQPLGGAPNN